MQNIQPASQQVSILQRRNALRLLAILGVIGITLSSMNWKSSLQADAKRNAAKSVDRTSKVRRVALNNKTTSEPLLELPTEIAHLVPLTTKLCQYQTFGPPAGCATGNCGTGGKCNSGHSPLTPRTGNMFWGVDCADGRCGELGWKACRPINWQAFAQGEYVGHHRTPHVAVYRLRVDDLLDFVFRLTRIENPEPYKLQVGDTVSVRSLTDTNNLVQASVEVQPDGSVTLLMLKKPIHAAGRTLSDLRDVLQEEYKAFYKVPAISVTPVRINTRLQDLLDTVDARQGSGGQRLQARVSPDGTVQLPGLGSVCAHGLTLEELKQEVDARYRSLVPGVEVTPILTQRAPRFAYVLGEVGRAGRIQLDAPTTVMMAIAQAGGWNGLNANMRQVVVFRRGDDWRLMATMIDIQGALAGRRPCPADEIWLNDSDIIVVPKTPIRVANEFIEQVFTRGIYGVVPQGGSGIGINFSTSTSL